MEIKVTVTHELGEATKKFLEGVFSTASSAKVSTTTSKAKNDEPVKEPAAASPEKEEKPAARKATKAPATRTRKAAPKEPEEPTFADMSDDEKLDEIKTQITNTTKKRGGASDVREILGVFDASRAGDLNAEDYDEFYEALMRYRGGESVDEIFPELD